MAARSDCTAIIGQEVCGRKRGFVTWALKSGTRMTADLRGSDTRAFLI